MVYFKSIVAGLAAFMMSLIVYVLMLVLYFTHVLQTLNIPAGSDVAFSLSSFPGTIWLPIIVGVIAFGAGFYWRFTRVPPH